MIDKRPLLIKLSGILFFVFLWELIYQIVHLMPSIPDIFVPSIYEVISKSLPGLSIFAETKVSAISLISETGSYFGALKAIIIHSIFTIMRFLSGVLSGIIIGVLLGVVITLNIKIKKSLEFLINYLRTLPLLALIPIFLVWFGDAEIGKYLFTTFAISVILFVNTVVAVKNLDPIFINFALTLGSSKFQLIKTVVLPGILPELTGGVKVILGTGWAIVLASEYIAAQNGLGKLLIMSQLYFSPGRMVVILLVFMSYSLIVNYIAVKIIKYVTRWKV